MSKTVTAISSGRGFLTVGSKSIIIATDKTTCGASFLPQQNLAVRTNGSGSGSNNSSNSSTPINSSITYDDFINNFSKPPKQPLTEEEKLLTQEECKMIILHVWGDAIVQNNAQKNFPKLSIQDRKYITDMYFSKVEKDESMSIITSVLGSFGNLTSKAALAAIEKTIVKDIAEMELKSTTGKWWNNEARQKYFKVGWSKNPVDRFKDINVGILISLKRDERSHITNMLNLDRGF